MELSWYLPAVLCTSVVGEERRTRSPRYTNLQASVAQLVDLPASSSQKIAKIAQVVEQRTRNA